MSAPISLAIHGGAWAIPDADIPSTLTGLEEATAAGWAVLSGGGTALDAVEAAVRVLERHPVFDAGVGSVLNSKREVECDALVIDGQTLASGAVMGLNNVRHPVSAARRLMERTPHAIVAGAGAREFSSETAPPQELCDEAMLVTPAASAEWELSRSYAATVDIAFAGEPSAVSTEATRGHDTVGAVALDAAGHVAAATSTGGITMKMRGRVGDSPIVGCGAFADDSEGAASTTGHGESILKTFLASRAIGAMRTPAGYVSGLCVSGGGSPAQRSAKEAVHFMQCRVNGYGGVIVVLPSGDVGAAYTTPRMAWGYATGICGGSPQRTAVGVTLEKNDPGCCCTPTDAAGAEGRKCGASASSAGEPCWRW